MKIHDVTKVYGVYEAQYVTGRPIRDKPAASKKDKLQLSRDAKDFQAVMNGLRNAPDIRADKVREISVKYESGERLAETTDIVEALLKNGVIKK